MAGKSSLLRTLQGGEQRLTDAATERRSGSTSRAWRCPTPAARAARHRAAVLRRRRARRVPRDARALRDAADALRAGVEPGGAAAGGGGRGCRGLCRAHGADAGELGAQSSCAPGSTVLLVGSHADELRVRGCGAAVRTWLRGCARRSRASRRRSGAARALRAAGTAARPAATSRVEHLERTLSLPLRLAAPAIAVSAKTLQGIEELRQALLATAFDRAAFPSFGDTQPGIYDAVHRAILRAHRAETSVTVARLQETIGRPPACDSSDLRVSLVGSSLFSCAEDSSAAPEAAMATADGSPADDRLLIMGTVPCEVAIDAKIVWQNNDTPARVTSSGVLHIERTQHPLARPDAAGNRAGRAQGATHGASLLHTCRLWRPKLRRILAARSSRGGGTRRCAALPTGRRRYKSFMSTRLQSVCKAKSCRSSAFGTGAPNLYTHTCVLQGRWAEVLSSRAVRQAMRCVTLSTTRSTATPWRRTLGYYRMLFGQTAAVTHPSFVECMGFGLSDLQERCSRLSAKVQGSAATGALAAVSEHHWESDLAPFWGRV